MKDNETLRKNTQEMAVCLCKIAGLIEMLGKSKKVNEILAAYSEKAKKRQNGTLFAQAMQLIGSMIEYSARD